jgi:SAM-dependent methyltransferase
MPLPVEISELVHRLRSSQLGETKKGADVFLTAGASGLWYFEWIDSHYGRPPRHIAIEKYSPRPAELPSNVDWIPESVGRMASVPDGSVDLIFSGQNIEHLWPDEICGFMLEAQRVLKVGGRLVMDSPNRTITARTKNAHPEHVIEFTPAEARALAEAAGFDVTALRGLWLCTDPVTGAALPLNEGDAGPWTYERRLIAGLAHPEESYVWWLEAEKSTRPADDVAVRKLVDRTYAVAWPERLSRSNTIVGSRRTDVLGQDWFEVQPQDGGVAMFGPYAPLVRGRLSGGVLAGRKHGAGQRRANVTGGSVCRGKQAGSDYQP